jgi:hypothetical protein
MSGVPSGAPAVILGAPDLRAWRPLMNCAATACRRSSWNRTPWLEGRLAPWSKLVTCSISEATGS